MKTVSLKDILRVRNCISTLKSAVKRISDCSVPGLNWTKLFSQIYLYVYLSELCIIWNRTFQRHFKQRNKQTNLKMETNSFWLACMYPQMCTTHLLYWCCFNYDVSEIITGFSACMCELFESKCSCNVEYKCSVCIIAGLQIYWCVHTLTELEKQ